MLQTSMIERVTVFFELGCHTRILAPQSSEGEDPSEPNCRAEAASQRRREGAKSETRSLAVERQPQPWSSRQKFRGKRTSVGLQEGGQLSWLPTEV